MTDRTINQLTTTTSAAAADLLPIWVTGSGVTRGITKANFMGGAMTGGGTVATGGFTLTVPATGIAAFRNIANTFTAAQTFDASALASSAITITTQTGATPYSLVVSSISNGANPGPIVRIGRNSNGSTPAASSIELYSRNDARFLWVDGSANLRIHSAAPTNATDTDGTVVGAQTSMAAAKHISEGLTPIAEVLASIQEAAAQAVKRFTYRNGSFNRQEFEGVVVDNAPRYGMDRDAEHPAGKSLNEITLLGDLLRAVAWLAGRVEELERR